tara:strand:- start:95 stop:451 length:357 start_codon:yes stop_codon:yes gene_type:complete
LASRFGVSATQISNILNEAGVRIRTKRATVPERPISQHHAQLGVRISRVRTTDKQQNATEFGCNVGFSAYKLNLMEAGRYDPTLSDLQRLSEYMEMPINDLLVFKDNLSGAKDKNAGE